MTKSRTDVSRSGSNNVVTLSVERHWDVQKKPYRHPLYFSMSKFATQKYIPPYFQDPDSAYSCYDLPPVVPLDVISQVTNKAYGNFQSAAVETAQNANNLLEMQSNFDTIEKHGLQLYRAYRDLRKGNLSGAAAELGLGGHNGSKWSSTKRRGKQASDLWLELHFGWVPLVKDIGTSIQAIQKPTVGRHAFRKSATSSFSDRFHETNYFGANTQTWYGNRGVGTVSVRMQAQIEVSNPNALVANQLGFVNPLSVAWEAVPFSFVVDWFSNVGQVLGACTDFVGLNVVDAFTSKLFSATRNEIITNTYSDHSSQDSYYEAQVGYCHAERVLGIEGPSLAWKPFKGFSIERAATAISLLVQTMKH